mgnify:CR=1 FL=1
MGTFSTSRTSSAYVQINQYIFKYGFHEVSHVANRKKRFSVMKEVFCVLSPTATRDLKLTVSLDLVDTY